MQVQLRFLPLLLAVATASATASTLVVSSSGMFSSSTPASSFSAPDETYSLSFDLSSTPATSGVSPGNSFNVAYGDFSYKVNGVASTAPVGSITFYNGAVSGLLTVCFEIACPGNGIPEDGLVFEGDAAYSGSEAAPTLLPGSYTPSLQGVVVDGDPVVLDSKNPLKITNAALVVTPEPPSMLLLGTGLFAMIGVAKSRYA